jgi:hypothetical protein
VKQQVKGGILSTLGAAAGEVRHTAALAVAKVAAIDIPAQSWPELIPTLLGNAAVGTAAGLRQATLEALGYVTEELGSLEKDFLDQAQVNAILTAVVSGMRPEESDSGVRLAATVALNNALEFAEANFGADAERNYIMQVVCQGTLADDARVRKAAWECLVRIAEAHYERLPAYMPDLFSLSQQAVRGADEEVALQALEFWCTVAEEEAARCDGAASPGETCHHFVRGALPQLAPLLLEQLTKQEEGQETEDAAHNLALMAGTALGLAAEVVGGGVVDHVMPYVQANIQKAGGPEDWRAREAATFAFGSIMAGPDPRALAALVRTGLPFLVAALRDPNPQVKNTTAWTIGEAQGWVGSSAALWGVAVAAPGAGQRVFGGGTPRSAARAPAGSLALCPWPRPRPRPSPARSRPSQAAFSSLCTARRRWTRRCWTPTRSRRWCRRCCRPSATSRTWRRRCATRWASWRRASAAPTPRRCRPTSRTWCRRCSRRRRGRWPRRRRCACRRRRSRRSTRWCAPPPPRPPLWWRSCCRWCWASWASC